MSQPRPASTRRQSAPGLETKRKDSIHKELQHRGEPLVEYPGADLWKAIGGGDGVAALIKDLYRRIEEDELLRVSFRHFNSGVATPFFIQWFGGSRGYSDDLAGGLLRRHQHRYISPKAAAAWLQCMRESIVDPVDDFQEVSLLCHAICCGSIDVVNLLLGRGAEVRRHSGKLLTLAVVMNRVDLVKLMIENGADVDRTGFLGRLDYVTQNAPWPICLSPMKKSAPAPGCCHTRADRT